jgi:hypothetical protein
LWVPNISRNLSPFNSTGRILAYTASNLIHSSSY